MLMFLLIYPVVVCVSAAVVIYLALNWCIKCKYCDSEIEVSNRVCVQCHTKEMSD